MFEDGRFTNSLTVSLLLLFTILTFTIVITIYYCSAVLYYPSLDANPRFFSLVPSYRTSCESRRSLSLSPH